MVYICYTKHTGCIATQKKNTCDICHFTFYAMSSDLMIASALEAIEAMQVELRKLRRSNMVDDDDDDDDTPVVRTSKKDIDTESVVDRMRRSSKRNQQKHAMFSNAMAAEMQREPQPRDLDINPLIAHYEPLNMLHSSLPLPSRHQVAEQIDVSDALDRAGEQPRHSEHAQLRMQNSAAELNRIKTNAHTSRLSVLQQQCEFAKQQLIDAQKQRTFERRHWLGMKRPMPAAAAINPVVIKTEPQ